jgi:hypothetical protein
MPAGSSQHTAGLASAGWVAGDARVIGVPEFQTHAEDRGLVRPPNSGCKLHLRASARMQHPVQSACQAIIFLALAGKVVHACGKGTHLMCYLTRVQRRMRRST